MSILVTGGAGFIGSHVAEALLREGEDVLCIDNFDPYYPRKLKERNLSPLKAHRNFKFQEADIRSTTIRKMVRDVEGVIHFAARPGVRPSISKAATYERINVGGTLNLLEAAASAGLRNFVFISSSSVYGNCPTIPWKEEYVPLPASPYGASKLAGEAYVRAYSELYGMRTSCLRYFSIYGPRQRPDLAIAKFTRNIKAGRPIEVFGDGSTTRDYTYISDAVQGTIAAYRKEFRYEVFNIGGSDPVQLKHLIKLLEQNLGRRAVVRQLREQKGDLKHTYADISKARRLLGYSPKVKIGEGIRKYVEWHLRSG